MKILSVVALAASCSLVSFAPAASLAQNSNTVSGLTCRVALEGTDFIEVQNTDAETCCYILEEADWYNDHDVLLGHFYKRNDDGRVYLTTECKVGDGTGNGSGVDNNGGSSSSAPGVDQPSNSSSMSSSSSAEDDNSSDEDRDHPSSSSSSQHSSSSSSQMSSSSSDEPSAAFGNPGNDEPVGGAGEAPNGDVSGFQPDPGTLGQSN